MGHSRSEPSLPSQGSPDPAVGDKRRPYERRRGGSCALPERRREYGFAEGHGTLPGPGSKVRPAPVIARNESTRQPPRLPHTDKAGFAATEDRQQGQPVMRQA